MKFQNQLKSYTELKKFDSYIDRYKYLRFTTYVGETTFGYDRYLNQIFYKTPEWKHIRREVIMRDNACDLGVEGYQINEKIIIHHMNPITEKDIVERSEILLDPEYLICVTHNTHNAIHYGDEMLLMTDPIVRTPNDTLLWRKQ